MPKYEVRINLNSISYEIEADNQDEAIKTASELIFDEAMYDIVKWAEYEAEELPNDEG